GYQEECQRGKRENEQAFSVVYEVIKSVKKWYPFGKTLLNKVRVPDLMPEIVEDFTLHKCPEKALLFPAEIIKYADPKDIVAQEMGKRFCVVNTVAMFEGAARFVTSNMTEEDMLKLAKSMHAGNVAFNRYEKHMDIDVIK
ncbi:MAG: hypothetical protein IKU83_03305, partial [Lachnospiraceae bacterium]|nr:hypothetical protein [Lachnospiraceae bacterium]